MSTDSFKTRKELTAAGRTVQYYSLQALRAAGFPQLDRLPYSLKILLENLLRQEDGRFCSCPGPVARCPNRCPGRPSRPPPRPERSAEQ